MPDRQKAVCHASPRPNRFRTVVACRSPPRAVRMARALRAAAIARVVVAPATCISFLGMAILIACDEPSPALAATDVTSFGVSATVVAYCTISAEPLLAHPEVATRCARPRVRCWGFLAGRRW